MRKIWLMLLLAALLVLLLSGCGSGGADKTPEPAQTAASAEPAVIEVDIARLNDTMAYAQMYTIVNNPQEYVGKTAKLKGSYVPIQDPTREGLYYHFLVVSDITACCEIGVEFFLDGYRYPEDYPQEYAKVELEGVFEMCTVSGQEYICLKAAKMMLL